MQEIRVPDDTSLIDQLRQWGPEAPQRQPMSEADAFEYVRELTLSHYENFSVLSRLVPARLRADFASVYAFCRWSDDLADETGNGEDARARSLELLRWWRVELEKAWRSAREQTGPDHEPATHPVMISLAGTFRRRAHLLREPFEHLIDAFEQDQRITRYETWEQAADYCSRSADPVGRIVLQLGGIDTAAPDNAGLVRMSDAICTALQLTNFWQDVRRDLFERDRVYLPWRDLGFGDAGALADRLRAWAASPRDPDARLAYILLLRPLVERTRALFAEGDPLPDALSTLHPQAEIARVVWLFSAGGRSVLDLIERHGCTTLWQRPRLGKLRKLSLIARASLRRDLARPKPTPPGESSNPEGLETMQGIRSL